MKARNLHSADDMQLFTNLAEQVKLPFVQIAHASELLDRDPHQREIIQCVSGSALRLIDGFLLQVHLQQQSELAYGSVSISSLLFDVAESLHAYAASKRCRIELDVRGKYVPAYTHYEAVRLALTNLGYSFIDAVSGLKNRVITLSLRKTAKGLVVGVYVDAPQLSSELMERARELHGVSHQPLAGFSSTNGAGVFVAESLFAVTGTSLKISRQGKLRGLAAVLAPSRQLSLV